MDWKTISLSFLAGVVIVVVTVAAQDFLKRRAQKKKKEDDVAFEFPAIPANQQNPILTGNPGNSVNYNPQTQNFNEQPKVYNPYENDRFEKLENTVNKIVELVTLQQKTELVTLQQKTAKIEKINEMPKKIEEPQNDVLIQDIKGAINVNISIPEHFDNDGRIFIKDQLEGYLNKMSIKMNAELTKRNLVAKTEVRLE